ncbi:MAG: IS66 family transposase [Streptosporangiaceae bacterium]|nr:IS66 family transposase [Streptosporangiaceae bacterium]
MTAAAGILADADGAGMPPAGGASAEERLARALEVIEQQSARIDDLIRRDTELARQNTELRELVGRQAEQLAEANATIAVLQRMVFGRSSEKSGPAPGGDSGDAGPGDGEKPGSGKKKPVKRGPGARSGRRDYPGLPRFEVLWDFPGGGYCCPDCGEPFTLLGDHWSGEQLDWQVIIRLVANCQRRYKRQCRCPGQQTVTAPGPPKAIGKGLFTNGFIAMLLTERFGSGRSMNSLVTGLARQGAEISPATLAGTVARAGRLLAPLAGAIAERNRDSWLLHADETTWRVFVPGDGAGPAKFWLWVFIGADTVCFVMDPSRAGKVLARHAGIDEDTGQLLPGEDGEPRRLVISSDFYAVYQSAGRKADRLVNLFCWSHLRRYFVRAGDANPAQLRRWSDAWLDRIRDLYAAHDQLMAAWQEAAALPAQGTQASAARLEKAHAAWDTAITVIDETRREQAKGPGLQEPAKKALATLDRQWDGLIAHRDYPMAGLDNNLAERTIRKPVVTRKNAGGSHNPGTAGTAADIWTVLATAELAGLNIITYLTAYLDECGRHGGRPLSGEALSRFLPWNASPEDLRTWAQPPPNGKTPDQ